ncbi:carbohydrate esterase family 1 protein [Schizophyllum fasciatum]
MADATSPGLPLRKTTTAGLFLLGLLSTATTDARPGFTTPSTLATRASASSGCGNATSWKFDDDDHYTRNTTINSDDRQYLVHLPDDYNKDVASPVVLAFHGVGSSPESLEAASQLSESRQRLSDKGIIAVYPLGMDGAGGGASWEGAPYEDPDAKDIKFVNLILDELADNLCVDTSRMYASGFSNGGGFTHLLACTPSINTRVAAFGLASGAYYPGTHPGDACQPERKVPVVITHGDDDPVVHFDGETPDDSDRVLPAINNFSKNWAERNGRGRDDYEVSLLNDDDDVEVWSWGNDGEEGQVRRLRVKGMDHTWPAIGRAPFNLTEEVLLPFLERFAL